MQTIKVGSRFIVKVSAKLREEMKVKQNSNKCMKMKIKAHLEFKNIFIPQGQSFNMSGGINSFWLSQVGHFLEDSGIQVKFLSLGSEDLELTPARTLPQAFVIVPSPTFSPNKVMLVLVQRLLAGGEVKCHSITDYSKCDA